MSQRTQPKEFRQRPRRACRTNVDYSDARYARNSMVSRKATSTKHGGAADATKSPSTGHVAPLGDLRTKIPATGHVKRSSVSTPSAGHTSGPYVSREAGPASSTIEDRPSQCADEEDDQKARTLTASLTRGSVVVTTATKILNPLATKHKCAGFLSFRLSLSDHQSKEAGIIPARLQAQERFIFVFSGMDGLLFLL